MPYMPVKQLWTTEEVRYYTYPDAAIPTSITGPAVGWTWSAYATIIPVTIIPEDFWIIGIAFDKDSGEWMDLEIAKGGAGNEVHLITTSSPEAHTDDRAPKPFYLPVPIKVEANARIAGRVRQLGAVGRTMAIKVLYATNLLT